MRFYAHLACIVCLLIGLVACDHRPGDGYDPEGVTEGRYGGDSNNYGGDDSDNSGNEDSYCWEFIIYEGSSSTTYYIWATKNEASTIASNMRSYYSSVSYYRYYNVDSEYSCSQLNNQSDPEPESEPEPEPEVNLYTFIGSFHLTCIDTYDNSSDNWDIVISTTSAKRSNGRTWVKISGLYVGYTDFMNAYGYYDPNYHCIRIPAGVKDDENTFYFTDDSYQYFYYAVFTPCYALNNGRFYSFQNENDEMWLRVQSDGTIAMTASEFPFVDSDKYGNAFTFYYYYEGTDYGPENNYLSVFKNVVLTRKSSYYEPARAPRRNDNSVEKNQHKPICLHK